MCYEVGLAKLLLVLVDDQVAVPELESNKNPFLLKRKKK